MEKKNSSENKTPGVTRRDMLCAAGGAAAVAAIAGLTSGARAQAAAPALKGNINHSVCKWCYELSLEELAKACVDIGIKAIDLMGPDTFPTLKKYDLVGSMTPSHGIGKGLNDPKNHDACLKSIRDGIIATAEAGFPNVICFSGNRQEGMSDEEGLDNCVVALKQIVGLAEEKKVTICMELLNSRVNHPGYMCDLSSWGVELCKRVGSDRFKLLYDIYHLQIMEGDIIRTIEKDHQYFGHYHTGGNPGRHEIDDSQELYYPAIMRAIVKTGYKGFVAQEFVPARKPQLDSLRQAIGICDV